MEINQKSDIPAKPVGDILVPPSAGNFYMSISSKQGTWVRISVKTLENEQNNRQNEDVLDYWKVEVDTSHEAEAKLQKYLNENMDLITHNHKFDAVKGHVKNVKNYT